jgi:antitoxin component YwqK of YwqJK toxin-antitoxin module
MANEKNEATFKMGKLHGTWKSYSKKGQLTLSGEYEDDLKNRPLEQIRRKRKFAGDGLLQNC